MDMKMHSDNQSKIPTIEISLRTESLDDRNLKDAPNDFSTRKSKGWSQRVRALVFAGVTFAIILLVAAVPILWPDRAGTDNLSTARIAAARALTGSQVFDTTTETLAERQPASIIAPPPIPPYAFAPIVSSTDDSVFKYIPTSNTIGDRSLGEPEPTAVRTFPPFPLYYTDSECYDTCTRVCGLTTLGGDEVKCCPTWSHYEVIRNGRTEYYCWGTYEDGAGCVETSWGQYMCRSEICSNGICSPDLLPPGSDCTFTRQCDGSCGLAAANPSTTVCCGRGSENIEYCVPFFQTGEDCLGHFQCIRNACVKGKCERERPCTSSDDCQYITLSSNDDACGVVIRNGVSDKICCRGMHSVSIWDGDNYTEYCVGVNLDGEECIADEVCRSGICIKQSPTEAAFCVKRRRVDGNRCNNNNHCENKRCGYASYPPIDADMKICCSDGRYEEKRVNGTDECVQVCIPPVPVFGPAGCFSSENQVELENGVFIAMKDVSVGDRVKTTASGIFEPIYAFGHYNRNVQVEFVQLFFEKPSIGKTLSLELTTNHLIFVHGQDAPLPAGKLAVGDVLVHCQNSQAATISMIRQVVRNGAYAPFTASGSIVVNGFVSSNYLSLEPGEAYLIIGGMPVVSYHWMSHLTQAPLRLYCSMMKSNHGCELYNSEGLNVWTIWPLQAAQWWLVQNMVVKSIILGFTFCIALFFASVEALVKKPWVVVAATGMASLVIKNKVINGSFATNKKVTE